VGFEDYNPPTNVLPFLALLGTGPSLPEGTAALNYIECAAQGAGLRLPTYCLPAQLA